MDNTELCMDMGPQVQIYSKHRSTFHMKTFVENLAFNIKTFTQWW